MISVQTSNFSFGIKIKKPLNDSTCKENFYALGANKYNNIHLLKKSNTRYETFEPVVKRVYQHFLKSKKCESVFNKHEWSFEKINILQESRG